MALAFAEEVTFAYPEAARPALDAVSLDIEPGEVVLLLGPSGSGKSTLLRAFAGLVPHFHGGTFKGNVVVHGRSTRTTSPAELAGQIAFLFQDPDEQVVLTRVDREVAFGLQQLGVPSADLLPRAHEALASIGAGHLAERPVAELSGGELQRVCLAAALALEPSLLLLDEPTAQLDPTAADDLLDLVVCLARARETAVLLSEQRPARPLEQADRVVFLEAGRLLLDAPIATARPWLESERSSYVTPPLPAEPRDGREPACTFQHATYAYGARPAVTDVDLVLRRGEVVALTGPNGSGKTTIAKLAAGLLEPDVGTVTRRGRAALLLQDAGRYSVTERADAEVALAAGGDAARARRALALVGLTDKSASHPRDLSSGERERLALAGVLVTEPDVLILDEPTKGADPVRKRALVELLRSEAHKRATLVVTHDTEFAAAVADRHVALGKDREAIHA